MDGFFFFITFSRVQIKKETTTFCAICLILPWNKWKGFEIFQFLVQAKQRHLSQKHFSLEVIAVYVEHTIERAGALNFVYLYIVYVRV